MLTLLHNSQNSNNASTFSYHRISFQSIPSLYKSIMQAIKRSGGLDGYFGKRGDWNIESFEDFRRWLNWYSDI